MYKIISSSKPSEQIYSSFVFCLPYIIHNRLITLYFGWMFYNLGVSIILVEWQHIIIDNLCFKRREGRKRKQSFLLNPATFLLLIRLTCERGAGAQLTYTEEEEEEHPGTWRTWSGGPSPGLREKPLPRKIPNSSDPWSSFRPQGAQGWTNQRAQHW